MTYASKRDANEARLIALWRASGCLVIQMDRRAGFDLLVICPRSGLHIVEIKDSHKSWTLTPAEKLTYMEVTRRGAAYNIITDEEQALKLIGQ